MDKRKIVLGIDTSNYTTSVGIMYADGELIANIKRPLPVKPGECGLRQSDAVFAHIKNLPSAMEEAREFLKGRTPACVGVSVRPRNAQGSYMPCFLSGVSAAAAISAALGIKTYEFSHQCGHIMAALYSSGAEQLLGREFAAFHVSGGTTELVRVCPDKIGFKCSAVGGTLDLNAGQLVDRIGVMLGLRFPCGAELEALALNNTKKVPVKRITQRDLHVNLSGIENIAKRLYNDTGDKELTAAFVLKEISVALAYREPRKLNPPVMGDADQTDEMNLISTPLMDYVD
ncbi:MAG: hypothetical protein IIX96_03075, partial [Clostridia bacterium]|nr:hypothetical protein [Clostridia bacterium]